MAYLQPNFSTEWYVNVLMVLQLRIQSAFTSVHGPVYEVSPRSFGSGCTHVLALSLTSIMYGICQCIPNSKLSSISDPNICEGRSLQLVNIYMIFYTFYSFQYVCLEDAHFGEGELGFLFIFRGLIISPLWGLQRWWIMFIFRNCNLVLPVWLPLHTQCWGE